MKNVIGVEITGTNTMIEKAFLDSVEPGDVKNVTFTQKMNLAGRRISAVSGSDGVQSGYL